MSDSPQKKLKPNSEFVKVSHGTLRHFDEVISPAKVNEQNEDDDNVYQSAAEYKQKL